MLTGYHVPALVVVSILVAMLASYTALGLTMRVRRPQGHGVDGWTIGGALAMGTGIWAMHFIGMLAFRLPFPISYDPFLSFVSWLLPVFACGLALWRLQQPAFQRLDLAASAVLMGIGINTMHYTGMAGMRLSPALTYDMGLFLLSIAIAVGASALALAVGLRLRSAHRYRTLLHLGASAILGIAIAGMHYTGIAAAIFAPDTVCLAAGGGVNPDNLAILVTVGSVALLSMAVLATIFDARLEARNETLARSLAEAAERQQLYLDEQRARVEAEHVNLMKDEFLATLSHELRTPLNAMLGWTQLLLQGERDSHTLRRGLETIERNARAQSQLIEDLLDMSRLLAGKVRIEARIILPQEFIQVAIETARPTALARRISLDARIDPANLAVYGDGLRMQQVMSNLLSNAIKFSEPGGAVTVALQGEGSDIVITVADHGAGIAAEFLPHVFARFRQADASSARRHGGLGLGLAIARQLVELQGGTIGVTSAGPGKGATFTVRLPRAEIENLGTLPPAPGPVPAGHDLHGVTVLVVDDARDALELVQRVLTGCGATVVVATSLRSACEAVATHRPDLLICDIGMPLVDGCELLRRVHAEYGMGMGAIALTALSRKEDRERALEAGYDEFLVKPLRPTTLLQAAVSIVTRRTMLVSS